MATYTIVSAHKATLDPGEIRAGSTVKVAEGDVFVVSSGADANVTFAAASGSATSFSVEVQDSNSNGFTLKFESNLSPTLGVADGVVAADLDIDAKAATAVDLTAGNNVQLGAYSGSDLGTDTISVGDGFTSDKQWKTSGGNDVVTFGDDATLDALSTADGNDTVTFGTNATLAIVDTGAGTDTVNTATEGLEIAHAEFINIVCFAGSTRIDTPDGPRAVEALRPGDMVCTLDNGPQEILWVRQSDHALGVAEPDAVPVLIAAGALGAGLPAEDLIVSPQHRILVGAGGQLQDRFGTEALVPAKSLVALPGIRPMKGKRRITWYHFACEAHEIVFANACLSESLLLGPMVVNDLDAAERRALTALFGSPPTHDAALNGPPARELLTVGSVRRRLRQNGKTNAERTKDEIRKWDMDLAMERLAARAERNAGSRGELPEAARWPDRPETAPLSGRARRTA